MGQQPGPLPDIPLDEWLAQLPLEPLPDPLSEEDEVHYWFWSHPRVNVESLRAQGATPWEISAYLHPYRPELLERQRVRHPDVFEQHPEAGFWYRDSMEFKRRLLAGGQPLPKPWSETLPPEDELARWTYTDPTERSLISAMQAAGMSYDEIQLKVHPWRRRLIEEGRPTQYDRLVYRRRMERADLGSPRVSTASTAEPPPGEESRTSGQPIGPGPSPVAELAAPVDAPPSDQRDPPRAPCRARGCDPVQEAYCEDDWDTIASTIRQTRGRQAKPTMPNIAHALRPGKEGAMKKWLFRRREHFGFATWAELVAAVPRAAAPD